ncbi:hypothetical protein [Streptomyces formicae]|uniref:hypothetical protein n=1 Tax=Streptomyces formicae TaxID=1616117 RepID=UPI000BF8DBC5|nr:hypothetical protein [Streptomyces formicae]
MAEPGRTRPVEVPPGISFKKVPAPTSQPHMPVSANSPARPAHRLPGPVDLDAYQLPAPVSD